ncbi:hypothetical protein [Saliphagus infecundisoli]|uniref:Uncharacterized protein n=1 Tax=Saliphagus infecundisoli TaxID=1849069 RepID=A0ABD5QJ32_9EURY|nr:hypothetical protein [Saliphagus infecundisoli]
MMENPNKISTTSSLTFLPGVFFVGVMLILLHFVFENPFETFSTAAQAGDMEFLLPLLGIGFLLYIGIALAWIGTVFLLESRRSESM